VTFSSKKDILYSQRNQIHLIGNNKINIKLKKESWLYQNVR